MVVQILTIIVIIVVFFILYKIFRAVISILILAVFLFIAYVTNPTQEKHEAAVKSAREKSISLKRLKVERENYYVFSLTKVREGGDQSVIGAGAFTRVFIFRKP